MNPTHHGKTTLTLLALASLTLTGCGTAKTEDAATQNSPAATSAAASTSSADSSQDDAAAASPSASATDSGASSEASDSEGKYSGGSKAPAGEYRAADEHGPAQNVPKPKEPEGMNVESTEGIEKFLNYWNDLNNYAVQTGDVSEVALLVDPNLESEIDYYSALASTYAQDGWNVGGRQKLNFFPDLVTSLGEGKYAVGVTFEFEDMVGVLHEEITTYEYSEDSLRGYELTLKFEEGKWSLVDIQETI